MTRDDEGYLHVLDVDMGRRCVLSVRMKGGHVCWAGLLGPLVFHGEARLRWKP